MSLFSMFIFVYNKCVHHRTNIELSSFREVEVKLNASVVLITLFKMVVFCSTCVFGQDFAVPHVLASACVVPNLKCKFQRASVQELKPNWQTGRRNKLNPRGHPMAVKGLFWSSFLSELYLVHTIVREPLIFL